MIHDEHNIDRHNELIEIQTDMDNELEALREEREEADANNAAWLRGELE